MRRLGEVTLRSASPQAGVPFFSYYTGTRRELTGSERAAVAILRNPALSSAQIAAITGCTLAEVAWARRCLGTSLRYRPYDPAMSDLWKPPADGRVLAIERASEVTIEPRPSESQQAGTGRRLYGAALVNSLKERCIRGHPLLGSNLSMILDARTGNLVRKCKACARLRERVSRGLPADHEPAPMPGDRTHCPHGHAYDAQNTIIKILPNGHQGRRCLTCHRAQARESARRRRARRRAERAQAA